MRDQLRDTITFFFIVLTIPLWSLVCIVARSGRDTSMFVTFGQCLSLLPGKLGVWFRRAYYVMTLTDCAWDIGVGFGTWFSKRGITIEPQVSIGAHCIIGMCRIGRCTLLGSNINILSGRHQHGTKDLAVARVEQDGVFVPVNVGHNVWIGNHTVIMNDIGSDCVIGAGAVVVKPIPSRTMAAGNPAIVKRMFTRAAPICHPDETLS